MQAFLKFNRGILRQPLWVRLWLVLLVTANLIVPLLYINRFEAQVVAGTFLASMALMSVLTAVGGFTRLLGLGHVFWFPLLYFLWTRLESIPADDFFGLWIRAVMLLDALSLAIDVAEVVRYLAGDRAETVRGI